MRVMGRRSAVAIAAMGFALLVSGCAAMRGMSAKHAYIEAETEKHVYQKPLKEVWPQARQLLFQAGYSVKDTDASNAETEWKVDGTRRERLLVSGIDIAPTQCKVQFMRAQEQQVSGKWTSDATERDLKLEYELIKHVEPDEHNKIESEADSRGKKAEKG